MLARLHGSLEPTTLERVLATLAPARQRRLMRYRHVADVQRGAIADVLARTLVGLLDRRSPREVSIARSPTGQPYVDQGGSLEISLAHSGGCVACAASPIPVGVDVEVVRPLGEHTIRGLLSGSHTSHRSSMTGSERSRLAIQAWTAKEAYLKMIGTGLGVDPRALALDDPADTALVCGPPPHPAGVVRSLAVAPEYALAVCTRLTPSIQLTTTSAEHLIRTYIADDNDHSTRSLL
jgi:4'-phosphopantetheinyl transferase